jgi:hypothetical protein
MAMELGKMNCTGRLRHWLSSAASLSNASVASTLTWCAPSG